MAEIINLRKTLEAKDAKIVELTSELDKVKESFKEANERYTNAKVDAARNEGMVSEMKKQLERQDAQLETWVRRKFALANARIEYDACDANGSLLI